MARCWQGTIRRERGTGTSRYVRTITLAQKEIYKKNIYKNKTKIKKMCEKRVGYREGVGEVMVRGGGGRGDGEGSGQIRQL